MKKTFLLAAAALAVTLAAPVYAAGDGKHPKQVDWAFDGVFGRFDKPAIQRGLQVYKEVCAACHSLQRVPFRTLTGAGFSEAEVKSLAATYTVTDGPNDSGEMFERAGRPSDMIPAPYANEQAARAANNGAYPPDLSLIVKARHDGANYLYSLLTGYENAPAEVEVPLGKYFNSYMPGHVIAMPPPLNSEGQVEYQDGTTATVDQMARDVTAFLQWSAEPEMEVRKRMGLKVILFLVVMTAFFYVAKKRIWSRIH
jgi:ubiquinol-cytochrome c reductase cytochrome c1 subunit